MSQFIIFIPNLHFQKSNNGDKYEYFNQIEFLPGKMSIFGQIPCLSFKINNKWVETSCIENSVEPRK